MVTFSLTTPEENNNAGFMEETGEFLKHGISASALSAGISIANTAIAFGNTFGADIEEIDTYDALGTLGMHNTAEYYREHKGALDAVGFVAGSLIPGTMGVKALRAAQKSLSTSARLSTGLRRALIPDDGIESVVKNIDQLGPRSAAALLKQRRNSMIVNGFHQQALEAAAFEGAVLLTMNQSELMDSSLDSEDLSYFGAIADNLDTAAAGLVLGAGVGGVFQYMANNGAAKGLIRQAQLKNRPFEKVMTEGTNTGIINGDAAVSPLTSFLETKTQMQAANFDPLKPGQKADLAKKANRAKYDLEMALLKLTRGDQELKSQLFSTFDQMRGLEDLEKGVNLLGGMKFIRNLKDQDEVFDVPVSQVHHMLEEDAISYEMKFDKLNGLPPRTREEIKRKIVDPNLGWARDAYPYYINQATGEKIAPAFNNRTVFPDGIRGVAKIVDRAEFDWDNPMTWRHETGHVLLDMTFREAANKSKFGKMLTSEAEQLSRMARPDLWAKVDAYQSMIKHAEKTGYELHPKDLAIMQGQIDYAYKLEELVADSYSLLAGPEGAKLRKTYQAVTKFMLGNKTLQRQLEGGKAIFDLHKKELLDFGALPTAADTGNVTLKGKFVEFGKKGAQRLGLDTKINVAEVIGGKIGKNEGLTPLAANALYAAAKLRKDIQPGVVVQWDDIVTLTAIKAQGIEDFHIIRDNVDITNTVGGIDKALIKAKVEVGYELVRRSNIAQDEIGKINKSTGGATTGNGTIWDNNLLSAAEIGRLIDTGPEFVNGGRLTAMKAMLDNGQDFPPGLLDEARDIPFWSAREGVDNTKPYYAVMVPDKRALKDDNVLRGMADVQGRIKAERASIEPVVADYAKSIFAQLPASTYKSEFNFADHITDVDTTSGLVTSANQDYMSGGSIAQWIGRLMSKLKNEKRTLVSETFDPFIVKMSSDPDAVMEYSVLFSKVLQTQSGQGYKFIPSSFEDFLGSLNPKNVSMQIEDTANKLASTGIFKELFKEEGDNIWTGRVRSILEGLVKRDEVEMEEVVDAVSKIRQLSKTDVHTIENKTLGQFIRTVVKHNAEEIVRHKNRLAGTIGAGSKLDPEEIYLGTIDTRMYPHHALVKSLDDSIMGHKDVGMIVAKDSVTLQAKIAKLRDIYGDKIGVYTNKEVKQYKEAMGEYESAKLFRRNLMDASMHRHGDFWDVAPEPNPELFNSLKATYERQHTSLARGMIEAKYSEELAVLRQYSDGVDMYNSTVGKGKVERNIYKDIENLMLDKRPDDPDGLWNQINTITGDKLSRAWYALTGAVKQAEVSGDWEKMNKTLERYGMDAIYSQASPLILYNLNAPKPIMSQLVAKVNTIVGTSMLRMDSTHAIVNAVSLPIMLVPEFKALTRIASQDRIKVLRAGTSVKIPGVDGKAMPSSMPLAFQAMKDFFGKPALVKKYQDMGLLNSTLQDIQQAHGQFARVAGQVDHKSVNDTLSKVIDVISKPSDFSEQMVKFVAARMADLVTDTLRIPANMKLATMNTFVNRVHGNYLASQRPGLFQGWLGQAIGLFQTYQFNLIQSLFKNVERGNKDIVLKMMGLQAGIFGAQSVPGFQLVNQYIGERSRENNDFYKVTGDLVGNDIANWLLYGTASSATVPFIGDGIDLYSRGDLTPRTPILIPTSPMELPAVSITSNAISSILNAVNKLENGAPLVDTMLDALGHNGFNRPLQGIAQLVAGERTTNNGQLLATYQGWDYWNMITKMMGTKPLDEAVAVSSYYRTAAYQTARQSRLNSLGEAYRQTVRAGEADSEAYYNFMEKYVASGGRVDSFNQWVVRNNRNANESQINILRENNNNMRGRYLQEVMGAEMEDYTSDFGGGLGMAE